MSEVTTRTSTSIYGLPAGFDPTDLSDMELSAVASAVAAEQQGRAVAAGDIDALVEAGFADGFKSDGLPKDPWMMSGLLICAGAKVGKSATSHECGFVKIGEQWVWEADALLTDVVRYIPGAKEQQRSISIVAVYDGLEYDFVVSSMRQGVHRMKSAKSYLVTAGTPVLVSTRARSTENHR